ncbi:HD domain-containing phosphohydrolase [Ferroacidibacillus organovorans]|nr:HD domain-containing phosphohydrolase [Ferroacidibacillus organovorans]
MNDAVWDELGKIFVQLGTVDHARSAFIQAIELSRDPVQRIRFQMHLALIERRNGKNQEARLILESLLQTEIHIPFILQASLLGNYGMLLGELGLLDESLHFLNESLQIALAHQLDYILPEIYTNRAMAHLELNQFEKASDDLARAHQYGDYAYLPAYTVQTQLDFALNQLDDATKTAKRALDVVWRSYLQFEREEIASLAQILAIVAHHAGDPSLALRLLQKALVMFGRARNWRAWQTAQTLQESWSVPSHKRPTYPLTPEEWTKLEQFVILLDVTDALELIEPNFAHLLDVRTFYTRALAEVCPETAADETSAVFLSRLADYGLTMVEPEIIKNPHRSMDAWKRYQQHPFFTLEMLTVEWLPGNVYTAIFHHHEAYDGTGFPFHLAGDEITPLARMVAITDTYAQSVTRGVAHSAALQEIRQLSGTRFDPRYVASFCELFQI